MRPIADRVGQADRVVRKAAHEQLRHCTPALACHRRPPIHAQRQKSWNSASRDLKRTSHWRAPARA
eukprot:7071161-Pyramimonas_sp.AAC.1